jgi:uncharacterized membrane-anchored protein
MVMIINIINWALVILRDLFFCAALFFSFKVSNKLLHQHHKTSIMRIKSVVFLFLNAALLFLTAGFILNDILTIFFKANLAPNIVMIAVLIVSNIFFIIAFSYFWHHSSKLHKLEQKEWAFFLCVIAAVMIWLKYITSTAIIPLFHLFSTLEKTVWLLSPFTSSLVFLLTLVIHPRYKAGIIRSPLWYISSGAFAYFIGFMMMLNSQLKTGSEPSQIVYTVILLLSAFYFCIGFYAANKKYSRNTNQSMPEPIQYIK